MEHPLDEERDAAEDFAARQVPEAGGQAAFEREEGEESLEKDDSGEGGEGLGLEAELGDARRVRPGQSRPGDSAWPAARAAGVRQTKGIAPPESDLAR